MDPKQVLAASWSMQIYIFYLLRSPTTIAMECYEQDTIRSRENLLLDFCEVYLLS